MTRRPWTRVPEAVVRRLHARGCSDGEIAFRVGCARVAVGRARKRLGLPPNPRGAPAVRRWERLRRAAAAERAGCDRFGRIRHQRGQLAALSHGWPAGVTKRGAQYLAAVEAIQPCAAAQLARHLGLHPLVPYKWLSRFLADGWVAATETPRGRTWSLAPEVAARRAAKREAAA